MSATVTVLLLTKLVLMLVGLLGGLSTVLLSGALIAAHFWLPTEQIAYVSYRDLSPDIYLVDLRYDLSYNLTRNPAYDVAPAWSPDGEWLAFASDRDGRRNIYIMDRVGRNLRRLTYQGGIYTQPSWTADGQRLIFISLDESPNGVYSIDLDGSNFQNLLASSNTPTALTLDLAIERGITGRSRSPDGGRIAFMTFRNQSWGIYLSRDMSRRDARLARRHWLSRRSACLVAGWYAYGVHRTGREHHRPLCDRRGRWQPAAPPHVQPPV